MNHSIVIPRNTSIGLKDLGLNIKEIVLYVTSECNLRCKHCYIGNSLLNEANEIEVASIKNFLSNYPYLDRITILGGEFFVHRDAMQLMELVASKNIKEKRITTNLNYLMNGVSAEVLNDRNN
jgi:molybdenum cofactor biosynthesis enzyme MoaA